jgi:hypothetical protein
MKSTNKNLANKLKIHSQVIKKKSKKSDNHKHNKLIDKELIHSNLNRKLLRLLHLIN